MSSSLADMPVASTVSVECLTLLKKRITTVTHPSSEKCHGDFFHFFRKALYLKTSNVSGCLRNSR